MAFQAGDLEEPAGLLHALPLVDFPQMAVSFQYEWLLPNGRNASDHHLFPVPVPVSPLHWNVRHRRHTLELSSLSRTDESESHAIGHNSRCNQRKTFFPDLHVSVFQFSLKMPEGSQGVS